MLGRCDGENLSHTRRTGEAHATHSAVGDQGFDNRRGAGGIVDFISLTYSVIQSGLAEDSRRRRSSQDRLATPQNNGIAASSGTAMARTPE